MTPRAILPGGIALLALGALGAALGGAAFASSWLAAALIWGSLPLGALAMLMTQGLTGGRWGEQSRPLWLALAATLPLFAAAMLPLLFGLHTLFSWTLPAQELPEVVRNKLAYLNRPFFVVRSLGYFAIWLGLAWALGVWRRRTAPVQAPGLILWLLALTFFAFDWFMSLEPEFYSDIYGLMLGTGMVAAAIACALLLGAQHMDPGARRDIANLWLAILLGWAFTAFSQYIVIWSANLPDEIGWYIHRSQGAWRPISVISFVLFFLLPFIVLLSSAAKGRADWLMFAAASCLAGHILQICWLILPAFGGWSAPQVWLVPALVLVVGAIYGAGYNAGQRINRGAEDD
ncbi:hypothetical protein [Microbulbifer rhizosphaerae]|uniref:Quinol:cytochrome c oxidoreductase quinone-binding subunit 2 n=1 Tax=Microbulbifer rhizosphaerae TaxID=1562603 RepID=A0A7W4WA42_9GAMM|nr:hypothetical protein [Microbulbifer rhizosphaerae]MBB3060497.1 hypothetical protein [Microbulbifer rhizosphaerae]